MPVIAQHHHCGNDDFYESFKLKHPETALQEAAFNEQCKKQNSLQNRASIYTIPVVFHVIHTGGQENISREQILDQMRVLNQDFNLQNPNKNKIRAQFANLATDCQIQFKLATLDPNGNCTDGINRVFSSLGDNVDQDQEEVKYLSNAYWDYKKYLNIWVVKNIISSSGQGTVLGYAYFPWMASSGRDGIVLRHDRVGTVGTAVRADSGRTLTHEVGHWLGLFHVFQGDCSSNDQCGDTPPATGPFTNANCPTNGNSCTNDFPDLPDQWENYMDYSEGRCMAMFTPNQKTRMHNSLTNSVRAQNVSSTNLIATGVTAQNLAPVAFFSSDKRKVCAGQPVKFYDLSCKATVTGRSWVFTGSATPNSSAQNPIVIYQTPGKYKVSLTVQNTKGSNVSAIENYIEVLPTPAAIKTDVRETFEGSNPISRGFGTIDANANNWTWDNSVGYNSSSCYKANIQNSDGNGKTFTFITPSMDLSPLKNFQPRLSFLMAYAQETASSSEILRVSYSVDCGNTYTQIWERSAGSLAYTGAPLTPNFVPSGTTQWRTAAIGLSDFDTAKNIIFKFDAISAKGNPIFIDNINISRWTVGNQQLHAEDIALALMPNPSKGAFLAEFDLPQGSLYQIQAISTTGKILANLSTGKAVAGKNVVSINAQNLIKQGIVFIKISTPFGDFVKPLTFAP